MSTTKEQEARIAAMVVQCVPCGSVFTQAEFTTGCPKCGKNYIRSPPAVLPPKVCCAECGVKLGDGALVPVPAHLAALVINAALEAERREGMLSELLAAKQRGGGGLKAAPEDWRAYGISPPLDESQLEPKAATVRPHRFDLATALKTSPPPPI